MNQIEKLIYDYIKKLNDSWIDTESNIFNICKELKITYEVLNVNLNSLYHKGKLSKIPVIKEKNKVVPLYEYDILN